MSLTPKTVELPPAFPISFDHSANRENDSVSDPVMNYERIIGRTEGLSCVCCIRGQKTLKGEQTKT